MMVFDRLVDDARLLDPDASPTADARDLSPLARPVGTVARLVVPDRELNRIAGIVPAGQQVAVSVLNTSGAGGLLGLGRRAWPQLEVGAAESALRDLDDLAGSAARVVAAGQELDADTDLFVELPHAPGWLRAVEVVEAAGRYAKLDLGGVGSPVAVEQLSALIEADLAFKVSGLRPDRLLPLLVTVAALIEDAPTDEAVRLLTADPADCGPTVHGWDATTQTRVRRRLLSVDSTDLAATLAHPVLAGLLTAR